MNCYS